MIYPGSTLMDILAMVVMLFACIGSYRIGRFVERHNLKRWWRGKKQNAMRKWLRFKYRNQDGDTCCCGSNIDQMVPGITCAGTCKSMKEWVIEEEVKRRVH